MPDHVPTPTVHRGPSPGARWVRLAYGIHRLPSEPVPVDAGWDEKAARRRTALIADLWAWRPVLRDSACFTHLTAAVVRGWWLPQLPDGLPIWIAQSADQHPSRRGGVRVIRRAAPTPYQDVDGLPLATPAETIADCARDLSVLDLVLIIDGALHCGDTSRDALDRIAATRRRGAPRLRAALRLCDPRTESAWETPFRLLHQVCGVPVVPQVDLVVEGRVIGRADLLIAGTRSIHEFDGGGHRDRDQHRRDLERDRALTAARITRRGYTAQDLARYPHTILIEACTSLGWRFEWSRLDPWWPLWNQSCFTPEGRQALAARIARKQVRKGPVE